MILRKEEIAGMLVLAAIVLGLISPIVAFFAAKPVEIPKAIFGFPFARELKYVTSKSFNVTEEFKLALDVSGGGAEVAKSHVENEVKVEIYEYSVFFRFFGRPARKEYSIEFANNTLHVAIIGYVAKIYVPQELLEEISSIISGGGLSVNINAENMKLCNVKVSGGGVELSLGNLRNSTLDIEISGGGFSVNLNYSDYVGKAEINVNINGGGGELKVENINAKVKVDASISGGGGTVKINDVKIISIGGASETKTYVDEGFDKAAEKLIVNINVSGGGFDVGIRR